MVNLKGYSILNIGKPTRILRYKYGYSSSAIDITLASAQASKMFHNWKIHEDSSSDHVPIITQLRTTAKRRQVRQLVYKVPYTELRRAFKNIYRDTIGDSGARLLETLDLLKEFRATYTPIHRVCKWWNSNLKAIKKSKNRAQANKQWKTYVRLRREFRKEFKRAKRQYEKGSDDGTRTK